MSILTENKNDKPTHQVIDIVYHDHENNIAFTGSYEECLNWKSDQGFGYRVEPIIKNE